MEDKNKTLMNDKRVWLLLLLLLIAFGTYFWYMKRQPVDTLPVQNENIKVDTTMKEQPAVYIDSTKSRGAWEYRVVTAPTGESLVMNLLMGDKQPGDIQTAIRIANNNHEGNRFIFHLSGVELDTDVATVSFDGKSPKKTKISKERNNNPGAFELESADELIKSMMNAKEVSISVQVKGSGTRKFTFYTDGFFWDR